MMDSEGSYSAMILASRFKFLLWLAAASFLADAHATLVLTHPPAEAPGDQRFEYYWELLAAALNANRERYGEFRLKSHSQALTFPRAVAEVESGRGLVNIVSRAANRDLEKRLLPIPIPLDKGLLGVRLFLVTPQTQARLKQIETGEALRRFTIGQHSTWTDVNVLRSAGFQLVLSDSFPSLFQMLGAGRFDLLSRGVIEIAAEWRTYAPSVPGMLIEERFLLQYPSPRYFYVTRNAQGRQIAERIHDGLLRLRASGEFERRYQAHKKFVLKDLNLAGRIVVRLPNPELSELAPVNDPYWWDDLAAELDPRRKP